jgi:nucleotide-binding universal stress UspA family protein
VHVVEKLATGGIAGPDVLVDQRAVEAPIREQARQLRAEGIRCTLHVVSASAGHIAKRIAEIAEETGADVIIVGTRGHSSIAGMMVGSVTQGLLHTASCPVLAVPPGAAPAPNTDPATAVSHA